MIHDLENAITQNWKGSQGDCSDRHWIRWSLASDHQGSHPDNLSIFVPYLYVVHPMKYAYSFVMLCLLWLCYKFVIDSPDPFTHILQGCFSGTEAVINCSSAYHWESNVLILMKLSSLTAPEVVEMTTSSAASDERFIKMMTFSFQLK